MRILDDPEVRDAINHIGAHARLLAGPGTGKTFCLSQRIATLIRDRGVRPSGIIAVTFTRAAAREMRDRLVKLGLGEDEIPRTSTLHSLALSILMNQKPYSDLPHPLHVADDFEERNIIFPELAQKLGWGMEFLNKTRLAYEDAWSTLQVEDEGWRSTSVQPAFENALDGLQRFYGFTLRGQLLYLFKTLLDGHPMMLQDLRLEHLIVDEYQDLNRCDQAVLQRLTSEGAEIFVAGDDDQSIYSFRHAHPHGIRNFDAQYPGFKPLPLTTCYRCPTRVIEAATSLISYQLGRAEKSLEPREDAPTGQVISLEFTDQDEEAAGVSAICDHEINVGGVDPAEILILLSRRRLGNAIVAALIERGVPYQSFLGLESPLDEPGGRLAYTLLQLAVTPSDSMSWRTWLGLLHRVGLKTCISIREMCSQTGMTLAQGLSRIAASPEELPRYGRVLARAYPEARALITEAAAIDDVSAQAALVLGSAEKRGFDLTNLRAVVAALLEEGDVTELKDLVARLGDPDLQAMLSRKSAGVRLMTMWGAKGLSADVVIVPGLEGDLIPDGGTLEEVEERRRLLYVSATRASHSLYLTHAAMRSGVGSWMGSGAGAVLKRRSWFLDHMGVASQPGRSALQRLGIL